MSATTERIVRKLCQTVGLCALFVGLVPFLFADTSTWTGAAVANYWSVLTNWDKGAPTDIAAFGAAPRASLLIDVTPSINSLVFNSGAPAFTIDVIHARTLTLNGPGIINNSQNRQTFSLMGGGLYFNNSSSAGNIVINSTGEISGGYFYDGYVTFSSSASAGSATINALSATQVTFNNGSSAANATITNSDYSFTEVRDSATLSHATVVNTTGGSTAVDASGTAGNASITNSNGGRTNISGWDGVGGTAANATITNNAGGQTIVDGGFAGNATITNNPGGLTHFEIGGTGEHAVINNVGGSTLFSAQYRNTTYAGSSTITNSGGGVTRFFTDSTADHSTITNNSGGTTYFYDFSTGGNSTIISNAGGKVVFSSSSTGGDASLVINTGGIVDGSGLLISTFTAGSITGAGSVVLGSKQLIVGSNNQSTTFSGVISGVGGSLTKVGTGVLTLSGANTYNGGTSVGGGVLSISNESNLGSLSGALTLFNGGILRTTSPMNLTRSVILGSGGGVIDTAGTNDSISGIVSGAGSITKTGSGTLSLTGNNTYTGGTSIVGGVLNVSSDANLGSANGALALANNAIFQPTANFSTSRTISLGQGGGIIDSNGKQVLLGGNIVGAGSLTKAGDGAVTLSGANSYTGNTNIVSGVLRAGTANTFSSSSAIILSNVSGAALDLDGYNQNVGSIAGGGVAGGTVSLSNAVLTAGADNTSTLFAGQIVGTGDVVKDGNGTWSLSGSNTFRGNVSVTRGSLSIGSDNVLGDGANVLMLSHGGILTTSSALSIARSISLGDGGGVFDTNSFVDTIDGKIIGTGSLTKAGAGSLLLTGTNSYSGTTYVSAGILKAGAKNTFSMNSGVSLANESSAVLDLNGFDQTIGSLAGGGNLGGNVTLGSGALSAGANNSSTNYSGVMSGAGSLVKVGRGTLSLTGGSIYSGGTFINNGALNVIGSIAGNVTVANTATLFGTGSVGAIANSGAVSPGINGVGNLRATSYLGNGSLQVSIDGSSTTALSVAGTANLNSGSLVVVASNIQSGRYTVLTSTHLIGAFQTVTGPSSPFASYSTQYTADDVIFNIDLTGASLRSVGSNANQTKLATYLDENRAQSAASVSTDANFSSTVNSVLGLSTAAEARAALNQLSGDAFPSFQELGLRAADTFLSGLKSRLASDSMPALPEKQLAPSLYVVDNDSQPVQAHTDSPGVWAQGIGYFDNVSGNSSIGSPSFSIQSGGFEAGYDRSLQDNLSIGFAGGYLNSSLNAASRDVSGSASSVHSAVYANFNPGPWLLDGAVGFTSALNESNRTINFGNTSGHTNANFGSRVYSTRVETRYLLVSRPTMSIEPSVSLRYSHLYQEGFSESGASGLNLSLDNQNLNSVVSQAGVKIQKLLLATSSHSSNISLRAGWNHEYAPVDDNLQARFTDVNSPTKFDIQGTPRDRDSASLGIQARVALCRNWDGFARYDTVFSPSETVQTLFGGASLKW